MNDEDARKTSTRISHGLVPTPFRHSQRAKHQGKLCVGACAVLCVLAATAHRVNVAASFLMQSNKSNKSNRQWVSG